MGKGNDPNCGAAAHGVAMAVDVPEPDTPVGVPLSDPLAELARSKFGPGHLSGRLEDYGRPELGRMLGFRGWEAKGLSLADLQGMALSAGLVPHHPDAPPHAQLAARWLAVSFAGRTEAARLRAYAQALNTPYRLLSEHLGVSTDGSRDPAQICEELSRHDPRRYDGSPLSWPPEMFADAQRLGVRTHYDHQRSYRPAPGARSEPCTPWDVAFGESLRKFADRYRGAHLTSIVASGNAGAWARKTSQPANPMAEAIGFYGARSGTINLDPQTEQALRDARRGKATPQALAEAADTLTHELWHAMGGGNGSGRGEQMYRPESPAAHKTLEEGTAVLCAERHAQTVAHELGLWNDSELPAPERHYYPQEREAVSVVAHLCSGTLDSQKLSAGGYGTRRAWDPRALDLLEVAHTSGQSYEQRVQIMADALAEQTGTDPTAAQQTVRAMLDACPPSGGVLYASERRALRQKLLTLLP